MGRNDHEDDDGLMGFVSELVEGNDLEGAALGVAKAALESGFESLTEKQRFVFDTYVVKANTIDGCQRCSSSIPWPEMYHARENGKLCNYCWHMTNKDE